MHRAKIFGTSLEAYSSVTSAQHRLNCYIETRPDGDKSPIIIKGTPGSLLWTTLGSLPVRGWRVVGNYLYVASGSALYKLDSSGTSTYIGLITPGTGPVVMEDNGVHLILVDGTYGWTYTLGSGAYAKITDSNFPAGPTSVSFLNGRFQVNKPSSRQFYVSQSYDGTLWTPVIYATKENSSDELVSVSVENGYLTLWGATSIEVWQDVGNSLIPYQRISSATQPWGLAAFGSRVSLNQGAVFLGTSQEGGTSVVLLNGSTSKVVSTPDIDNMLTQLVDAGTTISDATALTYVVDGHTMYQITFPTANKSILLDMTTGIWSEVQTGLALGSRHYAQYSVVFNKLTYISDYSNGNIYQLSTSTFTDNGGYIKRSVTSMHLHHEGNNFAIDSLWLDMDTGYGLQTGQGVSPVIRLEVSKDNGRTFGLSRPVSFGMTGQYLSPRAIWACLGSARDFVFRFTVTDPVKFCIVAASIWSRDMEDAS